jgi:hypothetical protein
LEVLVSDAVDGGAWAGLKVGTGDGGESTLERMRRETVRPAEHHGSWGGRQVVQVHFDRYRSAKMRNVQVIFAKCAATNLDVLSIVG